MVTRRLRKFGSRETPTTGELEREEFEEEATVRGFKYLWTRAWPDIVWADWTLSGPTEHYPAQPDFVWLGLSMRIEQQTKDFSEILKFYGLHYN
jgi:hypothetical protein